MDNGAQAFAVLPKENMSVDHLFFLMMSTVDSTDLNIHALRNQRPEFRPIQSKNMRSRRTHQQLACLYVEDG